MSNLLPIDDLRETRLAAFSAEQACLLIPIEPGLQRHEVGQRRGGVVNLCGEARVLQSLVEEGGVGAGGAVDRGGLGIEPGHVGLRRAPHHQDPTEAHAPSRGTPILRHGARTGGLRRRGPADQAEASVPASRSQPSGGA